MQRHGRRDKHTRYSPFSAESLSAECRVSAETFQGALAAWEAAVRLQNVLALEATAALVSLTEQVCSLHALEMPDPGPVLTLIKLHMLDAASAALLNC